MHFINLASTNLRTRRRTDMNIYGAGQMEQTGQDEVVIRRGSDAYKGKMRSSESRGGSIVAPYSALIYSV